MKTIQFILSLSLLVLFSCNKETGPTTVNGVVRDFATEARIGNARVSLFETEMEYGSNLGGTLLEEKYADASGNFTFDFKARNGLIYYVQAIKDQHYNDLYNNIAFVHEPGGTDYMNVYLLPEAYLSIHYRNILPASTDDQFEMNGYVTDGFTTVDLADSFTGEDIDTTIIYTVYGNLWTMIHWGLSTYPESIVDTIDCTALDTSYFEILY